MDSPNEWSQHSNAHRQRRGFHGESVDSASYGYEENSSQVWSWLHSDDDSRSQGSSFTERVHHNPLRHSAKKHRKDKSRDHRSRALEDIAEESGYEEQRRGRPRAPPDRGSLAKDPNLAEESENEEQRSRRKKGRQGRGSHAKDPDRPREPPLRGSLAKDPNQRAAHLGKMSFAEDPPRPTAHPHTRPHRYESEQYDSEDSFTGPHKHRLRSPKHANNAGSCHSFKNHHTGSGRRTSQQDYGDSLEKSRRFPSHEEVRPRLGSIHQHAAHNSDIGVLYEYYADSDEDVVYEHCAVHNADDDLVHEHWFHAEGVSLGRRKKHREPRAQHPSVHNRYEEFSDGRHNRGSDYPQHGRGNNWGSDYPQHGRGHNWGSDFAQHGRRNNRGSDFAHHGRDGNRDEDDYVTPRRIEGSDRHQRLLGPPSDGGSRRGHH